MADRKRTRAAVKLESLAKEIAVAPGKAPTTATAPTLKACCVGEKYVCSSCRATFCENCDFKHECRDCAKLLCDNCSMACSNCDNIFCKESPDDTCNGPLRAFACSECEEFICEDCGALEPCEKCGDCFCSDCADLKPGKNGIKQCTNCQPWWQKNKPASAFCSGCGSQRSAGGKCCGCGERCCAECPHFYCEGCGDLYCGSCSDDGEEHMCDTCGKLFCSDCVGSCGCEDEGDSNEGEA